MRSESSRCPRQKYEVEDQNEGPQEREQTRKRNKLQYIPDEYQFNLKRESDVEVWMANQPDTESDGSSARVCDRDSASIWTPRDSQLSWTERWSRNAPRTGDTNINIPRVVPNSGKWKERGCSLCEFEALVGAVKGLRRWTECPPGVDFYLHAFLH